MNSSLKNRYKDSNPFEKLFYEAQPFLYLTFAGYTFLKYPDSKLATGSAMILVFSSFLILRWRLQFRAGSKRS